MHIFLSYYYWYNYYLVENYLLDLKPFLHFLSNMNFYVNIYISTGIKDDVIAVMPIFNVTFLNWKKKYKRLFKCAFVKIRHFNVLNYQRF